MSEKSPASSPSSRTVLPRDGQTPVRGSVCQSSPTIPIAMSEGSPTHHCSTCISMPQVDNMKQTNAATLTSIVARGDTKAVSLLLESGLSASPENSFFKDSMISASKAGNMQLVMLLSSYGASRGEPAGYHGCFPYGSEAESAARTAGYGEVADWLALSYGFTPLQHLQVLTPERAIALLRALEISPRCGRPSPLQLAHQHPDCAAAPYVLSASAAWSPATNVLWPAPQRKRVAELCRIGQLLARHKSAHEGSFFDAFLWHVLPHAVTHEA